MRLLFGEKSSIFFIIVGSFGIVFMGVIGLLFSMQSGTLIHDIPHNNKPLSERYHDVAMRCYINVAIWLIITVLSVCQLILIRCGLRFI